MIPATMAAVLLTRHGGYEALEYRTDVPVPVAGPGEVLIRFAASAVNITDINTRIGGYSKAVTEGSNAGGAGGFAQYAVAPSREVFLPCAATGRMPNWRPSPAHGPRRKTCCTGAGWGPGRF